MTISAPIDSIAWDLVFDADEDLAVAVPEARIFVFLTREVAIELQAIPEKSKANSCNVALNRNRFKSIERARAKTSADFDLSEAHLNRMNMQGLTRFRTPRHRPGVLEACQTAAAQFIR